MARIAISFAESALGELQEVLDWYIEQGVPVVGQRLVSEVIQHIETLADHPDIGRVVPEFEQPFLRELIHPPFRIVYRRETKKVRVVRIWRSERLLSIPDDNND